MMSTFSWLNSGSITVITGPMFAGKTDELIRVLNIFKYAKKNILVFQPRSTVRIKKEEKTIISHDQRVFPCEIITTTEEIVAKVKNYQKRKKLDVIAFDEVQFLASDLFFHLQTWAREGKIIVCAGLDKDYCDEYQGLMSKLLVEADFVKKLWSICNLCQGIATHTQRMKAGKPVNCYRPKIVVGDKNNYQARCKKCYLALKD